MTPLDLPPIPSGLSLTELVSETGLDYESASDDAVTISFNTWRAGPVALHAKELTEDRVAFFVVDLSTRGKLGKRGTVEEKLLRVSFAANYVKALILESGPALAAEVPIAVLTPTITEGVVRGLAHLGDVDKDDLHDEVGWERRLANCSKAQAERIQLDVDDTRDEVLATLEAAGAETRDAGAGLYVAELHIGETPIKTVVRATEQAISLIAYFDVKPKGHKYMRSLLELNSMANVAKVGMDQEGDVALLYEVPRLLSDQLDHAREQFTALLAGLWTIHTEAE